MNYVCIYYIDTNVIYIKYKVDQTEDPKLRSRYIFDIVYNCWQHSFTVVHILYNVITYSFDVINVMACEKYLVNASCLALFVFLRNSLWRYEMFRTNVFHVNVNKCVVYFPNCAAIA